MTDSVPTDDTGRNDAQADPSTATESTQTGDSQVSDTSAATETTEQTEHMIPKSRLDQVIGQRKEAESKLQAAQEELDKYRQQMQSSPLADSSNGKDPIEPPEDIQNPYDKVRYMVSKSVEQQLGMPLAEAKTLLETAKTTSTDYAQRTWVNGCEKHNLDPNNEEVAQMVSGLVKVKVPLEEAFSRTAKLYGKKSEEKTESASVETTGQTGTMTADRIIPKSKQHARELAEKGVSIGHTSVHELIRETVKAEQERAGPQRIRTLD